jgi:hypothetical protein
MNSSVNPQLNWNYIKKEVNEMGMGMGDGDAAVDDG